jgi:hypothetical protein
MKFHSVMSLNVFFSVGSFSGQCSARRSMAGQAAPPWRKAITWRISTIRGHSHAIALAVKWMTRKKIAADGTGQILNVS